MSFLPTGYPVNPAKLVSNKIQQQSIHQNKQ